MFCWGSTSNGELGLGAPEVEQVLLPSFNKIGITWDISQVSSGLTHTLFLTKNGHVYSCGNNEVGQLGHTKTTKRPEHIDVLEGYSIIQVAAGDMHSLALTSWGLIYAWGENTFGQLGVNAFEANSDKPKLVKSIASRQVCQIACGANHSIALTTDNLLFCWGMNNLGQLGLGHYDSPVREPHQIISLMGLPVKLITAGGHHSSILTYGGFMLTWGSNKYGQLGAPCEEVKYCNPKLVPNLTTYSEPLTHVSMGENHTAVLDSYGKLWTFGYGAYGQLGHGNKDSSSVPRPVIDLIGSKVAQVACGRCHTLIFIQSQGQIYGCGQGLSGQLGIKTPQNLCSQQTVIGPWRTPSGKTMIPSDEENKNPIYVKKIFAGGEASFCLVSAISNFKEDLDVSAGECGGNVHQAAIWRPQYPLSIKKEKIDIFISIQDDQIIDDDLFTYAEVVFGSIGCWCSSFVSYNGSKHDPNIDYGEALHFLDKLGRLQKKTLYDFVDNGIRKCCSELPSRPLCSEALRPFVILPLWKGFLDIRNCLSLQKPYALALLGLQEPYMCIFKQWIRLLPLDFMRRLISIYKIVIVRILKSQASKGEIPPLETSIQAERILLCSCLKIMKMIFHENKRLAKKRASSMAYENFYIAEVAENVDLRNDYSLWLAGRSSRRNNGVEQVCFCEYSFVFDALAKTLLLRADATKQMQGAIQEAVMNTSPLFLLTNPTQVQFITLHVHRENIVQDTICQLAYHGLHDLKLPLRVEFIGEEAEDAGGVRKEFFLLFLRELLNPSFGMFTQYEETNTMWFKHTAFEADDMYSLIGIICGLAIYNYTIINLPFPLALYKKLLDEKVYLEDLEEMDPTLTRSLLVLLEYDEKAEGEIDDIFCLNFTVNEDHYGELKVIPLKEDGQNIAVNTNNRQEYVDLLVDYHLNVSIDKQYASFHSGFHKVCGGGVLKLFQPMELMDLVTGNENYDWDELQKNTTYKNVYYPNHPTILWFWEVFHALPLTEKKKFMFFLTGTDRIPILGMKAIPMAIMPTADSNFLPVAHTCVAQLDLPQYGTKEKLKYKLLQAIEQSEGFGLV